MICFRRACFTGCQKDQADKKLAYSFYYFIHVVVFSGFIKLFFTGDGQNYNLFRMESMRLERYLLMG